MVTLYTSIGEYIMLRNDNGLKYPVIVMDGKEYHLSVSEMILWTKGIWSICSHNFLRDSFRQEEKVLGEMNFDFILNRLLQRGLILRGEADSDVEALHNLIGNLIINAADVSLFSQVKTFLIMVFMMHIPVKHAKTVFKKYDLLDSERLALNLAKDKGMTAAELIRSLEMDDITGLILISNLYFKKLVRFSERTSEAGL